MNCVSCREPMVAYELDRVEVDHCVSCGGTWLDRGELDLLLKGEGKTLLRNLHTEGASKEAHKKCPLCRRTMLKVYYGRDKTICVDECPKEEGIWCDRGELEALIRSGSPQDRLTQFLGEMFQAKRGGTQ